MDKPLTLVEHLQELRTRIIKSLIFIVFTTAVVYSLVDSILPILVKPVGQLIFIAPQEAFIANIKIAFFLGLFFSSPYLVYQIWAFISKGRKENEKRYVLIFGPLSFILFVLGVIFGYFIIVPIGMKFLLSFSSELVRPAITISRYISFIATLIFSFAIIFQLPLICLFLTKVRVVTPRFLIQRRKYMVVSMFILAAALTPPDVITQVLMAIPLLVLYEIGIIFSKLAYRNLNQSKILG